MNKEGLLDRRSKLVNDKKWLIIASYASLNIGCKELEGSCLYISVLIDYINKEIIEIDKELGI